MPVRTDVLIHETKTMGVSNLVTLATVPTNEVWLVRDWCIDNRTGSAITAMLLMLRSGFNVKWDQVAVAVSSFQPRTGNFRVAEAGDVIQGLSTAAGLVNWGMYGSRLVKIP